MRSPREILKSKHIQFKYPSSFSHVVKAMEEYARLYHKNEVNKISFNLLVMRSAFSAGEAYQLWHNNKLEEEQPDFDEWIKKHFA